MKKLSLGIALAIATTTSAYAINVNPLLVVMQPSANPNANFSTITVNNPDSSVAYVQIILSKVDDISNPQSAATTFKAGDNIQKFGLIISPQKLAIQPNSSATLRVTNLNKNVSSDILYKILFSPVSAPDATSTNSSDEPSVNIKVVMSYQTNVLVVPNNVVMKVCAKANGTSVNVTNSGNTILRLSNGKLCDNSGNNCKPLPNFTYQGLAAGKSWTYKAPQAGVVTFAGAYGLNQNVLVSTATPCN